MKRSTTNMIRFAMDELLPPIIRDSWWFMYPFFFLAYGGKDIARAMDFKCLVRTWTPEEYAAFYENLDSISRNRATDLNQACIDAIVGSIDPACSVADIGCGNGFLLSEIRRVAPQAQLKGVDLRDPGPEVEFEFHRGNIEQLPFPDRSIDTTICTHTLEHCLDLEGAVAELKRITRERLIIVVPKQRYFYYTLDEHVNFFMRAEQLVAAVGLEGGRCRNLGGDWFYQVELLDR